MTISKKKKLLILDEKNVQVLAFLGSIQLSLSQKPLVIEKKPFTILLETLNTINSKKFCIQVPYKYALFRNLGTF